MSSLAEKLSTRLLKGPEAEPVILNRRRIYILPTSYGFIFTLLLLILLIGSINYNNSLGFMLTFLMASVALVSMIHAHRNLSGLKIQSTTTQSVFKGQDATFPFVFSNTQGIERVSIKLETGHALAQYIDIPTASTITAKLVVNAKRRGRLNIGRIKISTEYPIGLFHAWSWIQPDCYCIIYPAPEKNAPPPSFQQQGTGKGNNKKTGRDEFANLRPYQSGDAIYSIAWKQSARGNGLFTKQFDGSGQQTLWLEWEVANARSLEHRLSILCRWVLDCEKKGIQYGLRIPGNTINPGNGHRHQHYCLSALALTHSQDAE